MKILFDLTALAHNFSGVERYTLSLSTEYIRKFPDNTYILLFKNRVHTAYEDIVKQENVESVVIKGGNNGRDKLIFNQLILPLQLYRHKADVYLFLAFTEPIFFFGRKTYTAIFDAGSWDCGETIPFLKRIYFRTCFRKTMAFCEKVITISEFSKQRLIEIGKLPPEKFAVIYSGVSSVFYKRAEGAKDVISKYQLPEEYVLTLSTIEPRKNLQLLFRVYENLLQKGHITDLVLVGRKGWMMDKVLLNISDSLREHIHFTGFAEDEDLPALYQNAKYFVFPSKYEGFGLPPVEAMACGTPVLSSDAASLPEVLGRAAMYFENDNANSLTEKIVQMENLAAEDRAQMILSGIKQAEEYTWEKSAEILNEVIRQ